MDALDRIYRRLLVECEDEYVGLWAIVGYVQQTFPVQPAVDHRFLTLELIERMLGERRFTVGNLSLENGFREWDLPAEQAIERIEHEWVNLGRDLIEGDIAWFTVTNPFGVK